MSWLTDAIIAGDVATALDLIHGTSQKSRIYSATFNVTHGNLLETQAEAPSKVSTNAANLKFRMEWGFSYHIADKSHLYGYTPLQLAAQLGLTVVVIALLDAGVPPDITPTGDYADHKFLPEHLTSPLNFALAGGHDEVAVVLIERGANTQAYSHINLGYIGIPTQELIGTVRKYVASSLYIAAGKCQFSTIKKLVDAGAKLNHEIKTNDQAFAREDHAGIGSLLMYAVSSHDDSAADLIEYLCEKGAHINKFVYASCRNGVAGPFIYRINQTALSLALRENKPAIAKILMLRRATLKPQHFLIDRDWSITEEVADKAWSINQQLNGDWQIVYPGAPHRPIGVAVQAAQDASMPAGARTAAQSRTLSRVLSFGHSMSQALATSLRHSSTLAEVRQRLANTPRPDTAISAEYNKLLQLDPEFNLDRFPQGLICTITGELMRDPVLVVESGETYERFAITEWLKDHTTDPLNRKPVMRGELVQNLTVKKIILEALANSIKDAETKRAEAAARVAETATQAAIVNFTSATGAARTRLTVPRT